MVSGRHQWASCHVARRPDRPGETAGRWRFAASEHRFDPLRELGLRERSDLGGGDLAILEQDQRRDAAYAVFHRCLRVLIDVDLGNSDLALHVARQLLQEGRNRLARTAPFRPEVDQHRTGGAEDVGVEGCIGHLAGAHEPLLNWRQTLWDAPKDRQGARPVARAGLTGCPRTWPTLEPSPAGAQGAWASRRAALIGMSRGPS